MMCTYEINSHRRLGFTPPLTGYFFHRSMAHKRVHAPVLWHRVYGGNSTNQHTNKQSLTKRMMEIHPTYRSSEWIENRSHWGQSWYQYVQLFLFLYERKAKWAGLRNPSVQCWSFSSQHLESTVITETKTHNVNRRTGLLVV